MEANPAVALFLALGLIIAASRIAGAVVRRIGQPRVLGELIIGIVLGPTLLDMLHWDIFNGAHLEEPVFEFAELGVLLLMFLVGLEVNLKELAKVGRVAAFAGFAGALLPAALTLPLLLLFDYGWAPALFAGVTLAATSVSISAQVLLELGFLRTKEGNALLATALIDDILAILLVSLATALVASGGEVNAAELVIIIIRMSAYLVIAFLLAWYGIPRFIDWISDQPVLAQSAGIAASALVVMLLFAWSAQELGGVATITGSFIAGVGFSRAREHLRHVIEEAASAIAYAFLVPIFFVNVGLQADLSTFPLSALPLALLLLVIGIVSKIGGCGAGALLGGFNRQESLRLGVCMISRGEVGLIIASLGLSTRVFRPNDPLFASLFFVILLTTLVTPILVRMVFPRREETTAADKVAVGGASS
ncbi:MAG: cation:proton antiporter [Anaerolineae bacterium]|nr:cation:proton antiporter [Anaerolineae bacterium]